MTYTTKMLTNEELNECISLLNRLILLGDGAIPESWFSGVRKSLIWANQDVQRRIKAVQLITNPLVSRQTGDAELLALNKVLLEEIKAGRLTEHERYVRLGSVRLKRLWQLHP